MSEDQQITLDEVTESNSGPKAAHIENSAFGDIPNDWRWKKTGEHLKYIGSGISESQNKDGKGIPVSRIETIANGTVNYQKVGYVNGDEDYSKHRLKSGDLLFSNINSRKEIGKTAIYKGEQPLYHGINLLRLRYDSKTFNPYFVYYTYDSPMAQDVFFRMSKAAVGQSSINQSQMERLFLPTPPLPEQRKIATVLYTVDQAIEKTERTVEQMDTVQQGLLRSLFGKGKTGRNTNIETKIERLGPKQFQVPVTWETTEISLIGKVVTGNTPSTDDESNFGGNLPFVTPETLSQGKYVTESGRTLSKAGQDEAKLVPEGSVMMDCIGSDMGKVAVSGCEVATNQQINSVVIENESYLPEFLYYHLQVLSDFIKSQAGQTATPIVNKSSFESFAIFNPPIEEQQEIVDTLSLYDEGRQSNVEFLNRLKQLKHGLMRDLLSGKVRTTDTNITVPDEVAQHG